MDSHDTTSSGLSSLISFADSDSPIPSGPFGLIDEKGNPSWSQIIMRIINNHTMRESHSRRKLIFRAYFYVQVRYKMTPISIWETCRCSLGFGEGWFVMALQDQGLFDWDSMLRNWVKQPKKIHTGLCCIERKNGIQATSMSTYTACLIYQQVLNQLLIPILHWFAMYWSRCCAVATESPRWWSWDNTDCWYRLAGVTPYYSALGYHLIHAIKVTHPFVHPQPYIGTHCRCCYPTLGC